MANERSFVNGTIPAHAPVGQNPDGDFVPFKVGADGGVSIANSSLDPVPVSVVDGSITLTTGDLTIGEVAISALPGTVQADIAELGGAIVDGTMAVTGPLTNTQLRAAAIDVAGPLTNTQLRATAVPVSGPLTDAQLRNSAVPVSGPVTDTQLRANPVPVSGPVTDTQLRAAPVPVSGPLTDTQLRAAAVSTVVAARTPTTTSVPSSTSSQSFLASNANRKGFSVSNISSTTLYLSFSATATVNNCFMALPANSFIIFDQQLIVTSALSGLWSSSNGQAQVTEYV
ncbi:MAG: hypothetical protein RLZZ403_1156 [Pseudomonadota bacterium]|jgi:hypothetical protein